MVRRPGFGGRLSALLLVVGGLAAIGPDRLEKAPRLCLHHLVTGRECGGCGITRALAALARGEVARAHRSHPLVLPVAALGTGLLLGLRRRRSAALPEGSDLRQRSLSR